MQCEIIYVANVCVMRKVAICAIHAWIVLRKVTILSLRNNPWIAQWLRNLWINLYTIYTYIATSNYLYS